MDILYIWRMLSSPSLCASCTVRANKPNHESLTQRKVYCKGQARNTGGSCSKDPHSPMVFREEFSKIKFGVRAAGCVTFFWLVGGEVIGWCSRNLVLNLKLSSSTWVGALVPIELKDRCQNVMYIHWRGTRTLLYHCTIVSWLFFLCFCISSLP